DERRGAGGHDPGEAGQDDAWQVARSLAQPRRHDREAEAQQQGEVDALQEEEGDRLAERRRRLRLAGLGQGQAPVARPTAFRTVAAPSLICFSDSYLVRGQKKPRRPSLRWRGTTWTWRWGTLWLTTLLRATNEPGFPIASGTATESSLALANR